MCPIEITVVGDGDVGKTNMLVTYIQKKYPDIQDCDILEQHMTEVTVNGIPQKITLYSTCGIEYGNFRKLFYSRSNCIFICYSVEKDVESYDNVYLKWVPEIKKFVPNVPVVLVATKIDLREDHTKLCYTTEDGEMLRKRVKAEVYLECSALQMKGLDEVMQEAVSICRTYKPRKTYCTLM